MDDSNWVAGKSGTALEFNGTDEYVNCSGNDALKLANALTMSAWIKLDAASGWQTVVGHADGMYTLQTHNADLVFYYCASGPTGCNRIIATSTILTTDWVHVACVRQTDDTTLLYVNGVQDATTGSWAQHTVDSNQWYVGNSAWDEYLAGKIDEGFLQPTGFMLRACDKPMTLRYYTLMVCRTPPLAAGRSTQWIQINGMLGTVRGMNTSQEKSMKYEFITER